MLDCAAATGGDGKEEIIIIIKKKARVSLGLCGVRSGEFVVVHI